MVGIQKVIVFLFVNVLIFYMIRLFIFTKRRRYSGTNTFFVLIIGLSLFEAATLFDIIGYLTSYKNIYMFIKISFTLGAIFYITGVILWSDYTKRIIGKFEERSLTDSLTGVLNRYGLEQIYDRLVREGKSFYIIVCDLDGTKRVNDSNGHSYGDMYITSTTKIIKNIICSKGHIARTGGDEFVILLENTPIDELEQIIIKIKHLVSEILPEQNTGISMGYSIFPKDGTTFEDLMRYADKKMYEDKKDKKTAWKK